MTEGGNSVRWQRWEEQGYRDKADMIAGDKGFEKKKKTQMQEGKAVWEAERECVPGRGNP